MEFSCFIEFQKRIVNPIKISMFVQTQLISVMKKIAALLLCMFVFTFIACDDEPIDPAVQTGASSCDLAEVNTDQAFSNLQGANIDNYFLLCTEYRNALQAEIAICGDDDGSLQADIDELGDCSESVGGNCDSATEAVITAQAAFDNASAADYTNLCNVYKATLENQITQCGDDDGSIQAIIDDLGNCALAAPVVEISLNAGTAPVEFDLVDVVVEGNILKVTGQTSAANNYMIYFEVDQLQTGLDIINSTFELTLTSVFFPSTQGFDDFTSQITTNEVGTLMGNFGGIVTNADGGDLSISAGLIDITY